MLLKVHIIRTIGEGRRFEFHTDTELWNAKMRKWGGVGWGGGYFYYSIRRDETRRLRTSVETLEPARRAVTVSDRGAFEPRSIILHYRQDIFLAELV